MTTAPTPAEPPPSPRLPELARRYRMTCRTSPEWGPDPQWRQQRIGFEVELFGAADPDSPESEQPPSRHEVLHETYGALREVADWALGGSPQDVCIEVDGPNEQLVHDPSTKAWRVQLVAHVLHCGSVRRPIDESEERYVGDVKRRLASVGVREA